MFNTYKIERNIDIMGQHPGQRVTIGAGRFQTSDPSIQKAIKGYPGVTLVSEEAEAGQQPTRNPDIAFGPQHGVPVVTKVGGVQLKEKQASTSPRVTEGV